MHGAAQTFRRAMAIGVAKSVSFEEKNNVIFKISLQKVLKNQEGEGGFLGRRLGGTGPTGV